MEQPPELPAWLRDHRTELTTYAELLGTVGVGLGLLGPREIDRIWSRHILNCAVVADPALDLIGPNLQVADVGSGAGLPGLVWAICRPDLRVILIEPLLRRAQFLTSTVEQLVHRDPSFAERVQVVRVRAEDVGRREGWHAVDVVTARAVAPLDRLLDWTAPLLRQGGRLIALKGQSAAQEVMSAKAHAERLGMADLEVVIVGEGVVTPPTTVIRGVRIHVR